MTGIIVVNGFLHTSKFNELTDMFLEAARKYKVILEVKSNEEIMPGSRGFESIASYDFVLFWDKDILLAEALEKEGLPVFNKSNAIDICDHKGKTFLALQQAGIPIPRTILAPMTYSNVGYSNLDFLTAVADQLNFPLVVKEAYGSFGMQVYLAKDMARLVEIMKTVQGKPVLFQEYVESSKGRDVRLQVVGDKVIAGMYRYSFDDFRANVSIGGHMKKYTPSGDECTLAVRAAMAVGADFAGVDLLFGEQEMLVCEVNSNAHFKNIFDCTGVNTAEKIMEFIVGRIQ